MAVVGPFDKMNLPRIAQLINKTNQFNITTKRYSESDVSEISDNKNSITRYVKVRDRFGDNGLISVFIGFIREVQNKKVLEIDTWLMSCRVLKRGVEEFLFQSIVREALDLRVDEMMGSYIPTKKNSLVADLFQRMGFELSGQNESGSHWKLNLQHNDKKILEEPHIKPVSEQEYSLER